MSYQVIARKWRPQAFEEVTGQEHITRTLRNAIEFDRLHHAYLFAGARGVGKTTTARLLAKGLNCHKSDKPTITPCKTTDPDPCPSCVEITESRSIDVLEFDAASNTQVDKIREIILENINITPARDRFKVFIIDEVHMLSTSSFNALLKTVEEPPPNVVFIMATTELHKVPETITSRCQEFIFRTIPQQKIFERLKVIADTEKIDVSEAALRELARSGEGSMRDAQSNFDQVISFSTGKIDVSDVTRALGMAGRDTLVKSVQAIADHNAKAQLEVVEHLISEGHDLRNFCRDLMSVIRDLMVYKVTGTSDILLEGAMLEPAQVSELSAHFSESDLLRFFNSVAETETNLKEATQPRYMLELGLVRLVEIRRLTPIDKILERLAALEKAYEASSEILAETPLTHAATAEKKTLNDSDITGFEVSEQEPFDVQEVSIRPHAEFEIKLEHLTSADLEHFEEPKLDDRYEELFLEKGYIPVIANAHELVRQFSGEAAMVATAGVANGSRSIQPVVHPPSNSNAYDIAELPALPPNPSEEDLVHYAESHPTVRKVMDLFKASIVKVTKID